MKLNRKFIIANIFNYQAIVFLISMIEEGSPESHLLEMTNFYLVKANNNLERFAYEMKECSIINALHTYKNTNYYIEKAKDYAGDLEKMGEDEIGKQKWHEAHDLEDKSIDIAVTRGMNCECKKK